MHIAQMPKRWLTWTVQALILVAIILPQHADAAGTPTKEEWRPIKAAIDSKGAQARDQLKQFMQGRTWADGFVMLASFDREVGDFEACFKHADIGLTQALKANTFKTAQRDQVRTDAAWQLVHAMNKLGRSGDAESVRDRFGKHLDVGGWLHYNLSQSALLLGQTDKAAADMAKAMSLAQSQERAIPPEFRFHSAAIYETRIKTLEDSDNPDKRRLIIENLKAAAASYDRGLRERPDLTDVMFNLARMYRDLASMVPDSRQEYLEKSLKTYVRLLKEDPDDHEARVGLGLVQLDLGKYLEADNAFRASMDKLASASDVRQTTLQTVNRGRGTAILKLYEQNPDANSIDQSFTYLQKARDLGDESPDLYNNLLLASLIMVREATDDDTRKQYQEIANEAMKHAGVAPLNEALANFRKAQAIAKDEAAREDPKALTEAIGNLESGAERYASILDVKLTNWAQWQADQEKRDQGPVYRFLGHNLALQVELQERLAALQGSSNVDIEALRNQTAAAYKVAGDLVDHNARQHFLAWETAREGTEASFDGAWTFLGWKSYLSLQGWASLFGNYGTSGAWQRPVHLIVWGILIGIPLLLALKGMLIGKKVEPRNIESGRDRAARAQAGQDGTEGFDKEKTLLPNTAIRSPDGALERRGDASGSRPSRSDEQKQQTTSYDPSTQVQDEKRAKAAKAAAQVAKRLTNEQQQSGPASPSGSRRPARGRRRR